MLKLRNANLQNTVSTCKTRAAYRLLKFGPNRRFALEDVSGVLTQNKSPTRPAYRPEMLPSLPLVLPNEEMAQLNIMVFRTKEALVSSLTLTSWIATGLWSVHSNSLSLSFSLSLPLFNRNHYNYLVVSVLSEYPVNLFFFWCCCCCCCCWSGTGERVRIIGRNYFLSKFILGSKSKTFLHKEKKTCLVSANSRYPTLPSELKNILALKGRRALPILPNLKSPQSCKNK